MDVSTLLYNRLKDLYPLCRSLTGKGVRDTLQYVKQYLPELCISEVPTGTQAFDWTVPQEWQINDAFVTNQNGEKIIDFQKNNLHVVGYSEPIDQTITFSELDKHLYSLPNQPNAIPYVTSYYKRRWGFCITENQRELLRRDPDAKYHVKIDSKLFDGYLTYGECVIKGETEQEILLSTYICHPSMANNELSGIVVASALAEYIKNTKRRYTYRIVFLPETIGSILYLSRHLQHLQKYLVAGFVLTCIGDDRAYSYLSSRYGNTLADKTAKHVLQNIDPNYKSYTFLQRGSDERQYCAPGVDLPVCSIMRTKYAEYPEYHTSLDNLELVSPEGLAGGYNAVKGCIDVLENNYTYKNTVLCEPQMGKRGLYPTISTKDSGLSVRNMMNILAYADGTNDLIELAERINVCASDMFEDIKKLEETGLIKRV